MVSTRQCSTKFSVGETVLCYEPDESKAKVLYESKVLEVDFTKDEKGKKVPEYFVHFSGWNKSWDRWVLEDQVLEFSDMNKLRMKRLHEEAINRLKSKKKKKGLISNLDDVSQSSGEPCLTPPQQPPTPSSPLIPCIEIEIPSSLKLKLEDDCYFIKRKKKLVSLPRSPNIIDILKEYIDYFTQQTNQNVPEAQSSVQIVKEVMDGLRIYFDFTLPSLLLYNFERDQYEQVIRSSENKETSKNGENQKEHKERRNVEEEMDTKEIKSSLPEIKQDKSDTMKLRKSSSRQETLSEQGKQDDKASDRVLRRRSKRQKTVSVLTHSVSTSCSSTFSSSGGERDESLNISSEINEENTEKGVKKKLFHEAPSKGDVNSTKHVPKETTTTTTTVSSDPPTAGLHVSSFRTAPSKIYGAEHLLRLFVKLPSLLAKTTVQENRLSLLLQHLTDFLKFLSSRTDVFFSEDVYQDVIL